MDRCFTRSTVAAATLSGIALERHYAEVLNRTRPFRGHKVHHVHGWGGPWIENAWIDIFCCDVRVHAFGRFVPLFIQWVDLFVIAGKGKAYPASLRLRETLDKLLRPDVLYVTVSQNADGIGLAPGQSGGWAAERWPNLLVFSAGGVGHVPIPLIKGELAWSNASLPPFGHEQALGFYGGTTTSHPLRARLVDALRTVRERDADRMPAMHHERTARSRFVHVMLQSRYLWAPRGYGRTSYILTEGVQTGGVPIVVWDDLPWLPYRELWERGDIGRHVPLERAASLATRLVRCCGRVHAGSSRGHSGEGLGAGAQRERARFERMRRGILQHRHLFTYRGVLSQVVAFLQSNGTASWLRCQLEGPQPAVRKFAERIIRPPAFSCDAYGAQTRDECVAAMAHATFRRPVCNQERAMPCDVIVTAITSRRSYLERQCAPLSTALGELFGSWSASRRFASPVIVLHDYPCATMPPPAVAEAVPVLHVLKVPQTLTKRSHFDKRFEYFAMFLRLHTEVRRVLFVDGVDGRIISDPFMALAQPPPLPAQTACGRAASPCTAPAVPMPNETVWAQLEWRRHGQSHYMQRVLRHCLGNGRMLHLLNRQPILNMGVFGGERSPVLRTLEAMVHVMTITNAHCLQHVGAGMVAFNQVLYASLSEGSGDAALLTSPRTAGADLGVRVVTGAPLTHTFRNCPDTFVVHPHGLSEAAAASNGTAVQGHCVYAHAEEFLPSSWPLDVADEHVERHCGGYRSRKEVIPHRVPCPSGLPFAVLHKALMRASSSTPSKPVLAKPAAASRRSLSTSSPAESCSALPSSPSPGPLLVFVRSACEAVSRRRAVRRTWGAELEGHVVFVVDCCNMAVEKLLPHRSLPRRPRQDVLSPRRSKRKSPWLWAAYRWGLARSNAEWLLDVEDDSYVYVSALLAHLQLVAQHGHKTGDGELLRCRSGSCSRGGAWTPWDASISVVSRVLAKAVVSATVDGDSDAAWTRLQAASMERRKGGWQGWIANAMGGKTAHLPPPLMSAAHSGSAQFVKRCACSMRDESRALVIGHVLGPRFDKRYDDSNLYWCHALQLPSVLTATVSAPRHLPHTSKKIQLFATNPSVISHDIYLVRLTSYSYCSDNKNMKLLRQYEYERNSVTALMSKRQDAPLVSFTHSEDARALRVSSDCVWIIYNAWNASSDVNGMMLRRYHWPSLKLVAPPVSLQLAKARRREKNWSPFVAPATHGSSAPQVLIIYQLEPLIVLYCNPVGGQCHVQHSSSAKALWMQRVPRFKSVTVSGGTPCVTLAGAPTCIAHYKVKKATPPHKAPAATRSWLYMHLWYALSPEPPFQVRSVSQPFRFARYFNDRRDHVQYASGLLASADGTDLTVSFGIGDCLAAETHVASREVLRLLRGHPDVSVMNNSTQG